MENNFKEDMKDIRSKLQALDVDRIELASISGRRGSEWHGTDTGFALGRFLDYTGSMYNSPPRSLTESPIMSPPSAPGSDVDTAETLPSEMQSGDSNKKNGAPFPDIITPSETQEDMLPRDIQRKAAYYDYAAEKQLSEADAKLFYQRYQRSAERGYDY
jgi:hypothetical protein